jgi:hypothetical protein
MEDVRPRAIFTVTPTSVVAFAIAGGLSALIWYEVGELVLYLL